MTLREAVDRYVAWQRDHGATRWRAIEGDPDRRRRARFGAGARNSN